MDRSREVRMTESMVQKKNRGIDLSLSDRKIPLDLLVVTPEQFDRDRDMIGTVIQPAAHEGKVLYERAA